MQEDSMHSSSSDHMPCSQAVTREPPIKSIQCSHCALILKSKVYFFEHLNKVHGYDVDVALREAGFSKSGTNKDNTDNKSSSSGNENSKSQIHLTSQHKEDAEAKKFYPVFSAISTSKTKHTLSSSRDLKTYNRPLQTITKYFGVTSESNRDPPGKFINSPETVDGTKETLILEDSSSDSSPTSSGVLKVTAKPMIDISKYDGDHLLKDHLLIPELRPSKPKGLLNETVSNKGGKRSNNESSKCPPTKKMKSEDTELQGKANGTTQKLQSNTERSFEFSEDEEENKVSLVNGNIDRPGVYYCKHCDYSDGNFSQLSTHYQNHHPYIRYKAGYIWDPSDQSATFRCLECPVEFISIALLKKHYKESHPDAPNIFTMQPDQFNLVFKCFVCPFVTNTLMPLKEHYQEKHPKHEIDNSLMYCRYSTTKCQEGQLHLKKIEKVPGPVRSEESYQKRAHTPCKEVKNSPSPQSPPSKGEDMAVYHCNNCKFSHKSVIVMQVHYQRSHPDETVTIDKIKQSARITSDAKSQMMPSKSPNSVTRKEKSTSPKNSSDSSKKAEKEMIPKKSPNSVTQKEKSTSPKNSPDSSKKTEKETIPKKSPNSVTRKEKPTSPKNSPDSSKKTEKEIMPKKSPNSVTLKEKYAPPKDSPDFSKKTEKKRETSQQKEISLSLKNSQNTPEVSKAQSESNRAQKVESAENRSKGEKSHTKSKMEISTGMENPPNDLFYCQLCNYSNTSIRGILGHHNAKHAVHVSIHTEEVLLYSANVKKKLQLEAEASARVASRDSKTIKQHHEEDEMAHISATKSNPYACPENLFFCQKCNYGNTSVQGILNHQTKVHPNMNASMEHVFEYTYSIRDEIEKSKSQAKELPFSTHLPLPLINKGDKDAFFCHLCNFRKSTMCEVLRHYLMKHHEFVADEEVVRRYTAMVLSKKQESRLKKTASQEVNQTSLGKKEMKTKTKMFGKVLTSPPRTSQTQRTLQCLRCPYKTRYVYLLKRHMRKAHNSNHSVADVLKMCFKRGILQAGYHCDLCAFSHKKSAVVYKHYQEQHPGRKLSLNYVVNQLYVGPKILTLKKRKPQAKHSDGTSDGEDTCGSLPSQSSGQNEAKTFSCRACSFKGSSMSGMTRHYRAVHPWSVKDDGSVLYLINNKKHSANRQVQDENEMHMSFETYQAPLEFEKSPDSSHQTMSSKKLKCPICSAAFPTQHGLSVHCGIKHPEAIPENLNEQQKEQVQIPTRVHVFKCPHCTYVNTNYQGVLTHCQMRHPSLVPKADSLYVDDIHLHDWEDCIKTKSPGLRIRGYMCKTCPQIYATPEKLNKHSKDDHDETVAKRAKSAPKLSAVSRKKQSKTHSKGSLSKSSLLGKNKYAVVGCQYCSFSCTTKFALSRHVQFRHNNSSTQDCSYKCALCTNAYCKKNRLGVHYTKKHGKEAFLKYYVPKYKQVQKKPAPTVLDRVLTQQSEDTTDGCKSSTTTKENKKLVYKCPSCSYVNVSFHGTLTHCQMKHPEVIARADELQTDEIPMSSMAGCTLGAGPALGGYMCKTCSQVFVSLKKLTIHCDRHQHQAEGKASKRSGEIETEKQHGRICQDMEVVSSKQHQKTAKVTTATAETGQPNTPPVNDEKILFQCCMCAYIGSCRKYLHTHYKNAHKLDSVAASKMLVKYNKYKRNMAVNQPDEVESGQSACVKCKLCPDLKFDSSQLLITHYTTFHRSDCKLDFIVLSQGTKKTSSLYECALCNKQLSGIRKLCRHLDHHREREKHKAKASKTKASVITTLEAKSIQICGQEGLPGLGAVEERAQWHATPETVTEPQSPLPSPSKPADREQSHLESKKDELICKQCGRAFMSLKGLRSHERSHAALANMKKLNNLSTSALKQNIKQYVLFRDGTTRPFRCSLCSYKTTVVALWRSHFMKNHQDVCMNPATTDNPDEESTQGPDEEPTNSAEEFNNLSEFDEEPEITKKLRYLEPQDVQRQLNQYSLMAQAGAQTKADIEETKSPESSLLHCEVCNFHTGHLSSIRRHYLNRHGKKILRCKDCNFFTGLRRTLEMHIEMGHSTCQSKPTHEKDLRCPFCLYQTKNKNNMIDHIVLHREERVVPIEVRRSKLSRYLQGLIFRCHKCTFTSGSADRLRLHMMKHDDVKPYKCRLCYFDCTHLSNLEAHLSDKHQVLRNHELVGQISLDQLEERVCRMPEEEHLFDNEHPNNDIDHVKTEEFVTDCDDFTETTQAENPAENVSREAYQSEGREGKSRNEESPGKISALYLQCDNAKPDTVVQADLKQDPPELEEAVSSPDAARGTWIENITEKNYGEGNNSEIQHEGCTTPEEYMQTNENQAQPEVRANEVCSETFTQQDEEATKGISVTFGKVAEETQDHKLHIKALKQRALNMDARMEGEILRRVLLRDEGESIHKRSDSGRTVKTKQRFEPEVEGNDLNEIPLQVEGGTFILSQSQNNPDKTGAVPTSAKANYRQLNNNRAQQRLTVERQLLTLGSTFRQLKMSHKGILSISSTNRIEKPEQNPKNGEDERDGCGEPPAFKHGCLKEEMRSPSGSNEEDQDDHLEQKQDQEDDMITEEDKNQCTSLEHQKSNGLKKALGTLSVTDGATAEGKRFACEFCGRNLMTRSELERHIIRHGI